MSQRVAFVARAVGIVGIVGGIYLVLASWAVALPAYEVTRLVVPRLVLSEPLIWLGIALVFLPTLVRMAEAPLARTLDAGDVIPQAYVTCPACEQLVSVGAERCRYCGEPLVGPRARPVGGLARHPDDPRP